MKISLHLCLAVLAVLLFPLATPGALEAAPGGPKLGAPGGGPVIDKSGDELLQQMITASVPRFTQERFTDQSNGVSLTYNLFRPGIAPGEKAPLVLFMADASTPGPDPLRPLRQGYGALVWATDAWQTAHPCYILVPQFSGVAVNDAYERTAEVGSVLRLVEHVAATENVDTSRIYTTGQSMGGMISMFSLATRPGLFAAGLFVDCHWDTALFPRLVESPFTFIAAGTSGKSFAMIAELEKAARAREKPVAFAEWSARLPLDEQDNFARDLLAKGEPINIINFAPGSVLPADGKGSEHMYSFDCAYRLAPVREWLFRQTRPGP